jgi:hypothetical protein
MSSAQGGSVVQRARKAEPVPATVWEEHRETITELHPQMTLEDLMKNMKEIHGFRARYEVSIWGFQLT